MRRSLEEKGRSHARIAASASRILHERGLEGASMADVMRDAGLSYGGFPERFGNEDTLVGAALDAASAKSAGHLAAGGAGDALARRRAARVQRLGAGAGERPPPQAGGAGRSGVAPRTTFVRRLGSARLLSAAGALAGSSAAAPASAATSPLDGASGPLLGFGLALDGRLRALHDAFALVGTALLDLPRALPTALVQASGDRPLALAGALAAMLLAGCGCEALFRRWAGPWERLLDDNPLLTVRGRALAQAERFAYAQVIVASFASGVAATDLALAPGGRAGLLALDAALGVIGVRAVLTLGRFLIAPGGPRYRPVALTTGAARHAFSWLKGLAVAGCAGLETSAALRLGGEGRAADGIVSATALALSLLLPLAFALAVRRDGRPTGVPRGLHPVLLSLPPLTWLLDAAGFGCAAWTVLALGVVPPLASALAGVARWIAFGTAGDEVPSHAERLVVRAARDGALAAALLLVLAGAGETGSAERPLALGVVEAVAVLLLADMAWCVARGLVDHRLARAAAEAGQRLVTVLPALRRVALAVISLGAAFGVTSALGLHLGPLLAGAGVVGLAIGIGAQAIVRDVVAGLFLLLEDAFRVGEAVESGALSGTVESFSLRSVRLRDDAGRVHTVAFGELKAVTNLSRDWSGMEVPLFVDGGAPLGAVEAVVADAMAALEADAAFAGALLQPPRFLGATALSESSIKLVVLLKTVPGRQFAARSALLRRMLVGMAAAGLPVGVGLSADRRPRRRRMDAPRP